ncbi:MAG: L17 family ribosomal protein, partial [Clostridia bacterium]|nr:L17 family ribosomal protein [Clostridia bacterium]
AMLSNLATDILWYGHIETTFDRAKAAAKIVEKIITLAINSYEDVVTVEKTTLDSNGKVKKVTVSKDGVKKLNARRQIIAMVEDRQEQRKKGEKLVDFEARVGDVKMPLIEKIFDDIAPKYAERAKELGQKGGYTRVIKTSVRRGDNAQMALVELV